MGLLNKKTVDDINAKGKKVLVRCDFNVPLKDGVITDENRITAALPTIKKLIADGAQVILCSHLGKVKNGPNEKESLAPVAKRLAELLNKEVVFAADDVVVGENGEEEGGCVEYKLFVLQQGDGAQGYERKQGKGIQPHDIPLVSKRPGAVGIECTEKGYGKIVFVKHLLQKNGKEQSGEAQFNGHQQTVELQKPGFRNQNTQQV